MDLDLPARPGIRALPAGRWADALVARWALGQDPLWVQGDCVLAGPDGWLPVPLYSTNAALARELLVVAGERWPLAAFTFVLGRQGTGWAVRVANTVEHGTSWVGTVEAPNQALATCRALLYACTLDPWERNPPADA